MKTKAQENLTAIEGTSDKIQSLLQAVQTASADVGVSKYSHIFNNESKKDIQWSWVWIAATFVLSVAGVAGIVWWVQYQPLEGTELKHIVGFAGGKLFAVSMLYVLIALVVRNYKACKHNAALNRHRQNALQIFPILYESATDVGAKDVILRQATDAIFGVQNTGYLSKESGTGGLKQVVEIFRKPPEAEG